VATLVGAAVVAALNVVDLTSRVPPPPVGDVPHGMLDYVTRSERRFAAFREHARARALSGTIGYLESPPDPSHRDAEADYFIAQFVLLPLVLDLDLSRSQWALGNFRSPVPALPAGWRMAQDLGQGVLLLEKSGQ
jgi:hypothetical protein